MDLVFVTLSSAALVTIFGWLSRNLILTRLSNAVKHEYDQKLENVKNELKARQSEIETLRTFALSGASARQIEYCQRQVAAVEHLWSAIIQLTPAKKAVNFMSVIDFNKAIMAVKSKPHNRKVFAALLSEFDHGILDNPEAARHRPFVSPLAWALYSAYVAILKHETARLKVLEEGTCDGYIDCDIEEMIKVALPHCAESIRKNQFRELIGELESSLLQELRNTLEGEGTDQKNLVRAALILSEAERLSEGVAQDSIIA